jgi:hypothetical protein
LPTEEWFGAVLEAEVLAPLPVGLVDGRLISVTSLLRREQRSPTGVPKTQSCWAPNKVAIDFEGGATWEEYAIVRLLERQGWWACWVKFWYGTREFCQRPGAATRPPPEAQAAFDRIARTTGGAGAWDVFAWKDGPLFVESKQYRSTDRLNANQISWLTTALNEGWDASRFAVVNYDAGRPLPLRPDAPIRQIGTTSRLAPASHPSTKRPRGGGVLDQARTGRPPRVLGACSGINQDGSACRNPGRYMVNGKLSCSRRHLTYR